MKNLLMKMTSRERFDKMLSCITSYIKYANHKENMYWLFSFDNNDPTYRGNEFVNFLHEQGIKNWMIYIEPSEGKIDAINRDVNKLDPTSWDILVNISDDQFPVMQGYDDIIRESMPDDLDASLWFYDSYQMRINTQEILGRNYYLRQGYIYHPSYKSLFCDNEATFVAERQGKLIKDNRCIIRHIHPCNSREAQNDCLYKKNESYWNLDKANYERRQANNFV